MLSIRLRFPGFLSAILRRAVPVLAVLLSSVPALASPRWTPLGPFGGSVDSLAVDPTAPQTLYATTDPGGVFKSTDGGASWIAQQPFGLLTLRVNPVDSTDLWAGGFGGPFRSTDGGAHWSRVPVDGHWCLVYEVEFAPSAPSTLYYAGAKGGSSSCAFTRSGVYRSTDGGATWTAADAGLGATVARDIAVDPVDPRLLYAATSSFIVTPGDGVWKSTDGGASWARAGAETAGQSINSVVPSPIAGIVWAGAERGRVFRSGDSGESWQEHSEGLQASVIYELVIDPADSRRIYAATSNGVWALEEEEEED